MVADPLPVQVPPPAPMHVHVTPVMPAGGVSDTVAPVTPFGPAFVATIVYVTGVPGTATVCPSVFVIERSAWAVVSVSVAELLARFGSATPAGVVTVAVLLRFPVATGETVPVRV